MLEKISSIISGKGAAVAIVPSPEIYSSTMDALAPSFDRVTSVEDCIDLLDASGMIVDGRIEQDTFEVLQRRCGEMRRAGLGLEPNLLSRALVRCIVEPTIAGEWSVKLAASDDDWAQFVSRADAARDAKAFNEAEYHYYCALELYPAHHGVLLQYAHCLKEQGKWRDALVQYLDAALGGATRSSVEEHARFVARALGLEDRTLNFLSQRNSIPFSRDIRVIHRLFIDEEPSLPELLELMLRNETTPDIVADVIRDPRFQIRNRDLMRYLAEARGN